MLRRPNKSTLIKFEIYNHLFIYIFPSLNFAIVSVKSEVNLCGCRLDNVALALTKSSTGESFVIAIVITETCFC